MTTTPRPRKSEQETAPARRQSRRSAGSIAAPYVFLTPAIILFVTMMALPIIYAFYLSFRINKVSGLGLGKGARTETWAGLGNYVRVFEDPEFLDSSCESWDTE